MELAALRRRIGELERAAQPALPAPPHQPQFRMDRAPLPERLDLSVDRGDAFKLWKVRWEDYVMLSNLHLAEPAIAMAKLRSCLSDDTLRVVRNFDIAEGDSNVTTVLRRLELYAKGQVNEVLERRNFNMRGQQEGECFDDFLIALRELSSTCNFCAACGDSLTRDRIVIGLRDAGTIKKLCAVPKLTLTGAIDVCRAEEAASRDTQAIVGEHQSGAAACRISRQVPHHSSARSRRVPGHTSGGSGQVHSSSSSGFHSYHVDSPSADNEDNEDALRCGWCGRFHNPSATCPAAGKKCLECGKLNHFASRCPSKGSSTGRRRHVKHEPQAAAVIASTSAGGGAPHIQLEVAIQGHHQPVVISALPDTGADISVAGVTILERFGMDTSCLLPSTETPRAAHGRHIPSHGRLLVNLTHGLVTITDCIHILHGVEGLLLSWKATRELRLLPWDYPAQISQVTSDAAASPGDGSSASQSDMGRARHQEAELTPQPVAASTVARSASPVARSASPPTGASSAVASASATSSGTAGPGPSRPGQPEAGERGTVLPPEVQQQERPDITKEFPDVFDGVIRAMPGEEYQIVLKPDAVPHAVRAPRRVPFALREPLRQELQQLQDNGIITPVTEPTEWCAPIVVSPKKNGGGIRLCVDLSRLNASVRRELYQSSTPAECVASILASEARWFTVLDAQKGYHQCPLDVSSQHLTTFTTPFGRYMYLRAPYGVSSISEHYNRRMDECLQGLPGIQRLVDDVIVCGRTREELLHRTRQLLQRCREKGVSLNRGKVQFMQQEVKFAGFIVGESGYRPDPALTEALASFPSPKDITDLRGFFGLANQLAPFSDTVARNLLPLRELLSTKREFCWDASHEDAFIRARAALSSPPTLAFYDPRRATRLSTDASRLNGMGCVLQQQQDDESWSVVQAGSRFVTDTETRYAAIEIEMAAVVWAFKKCRLFLSGLPHFDVFVDHKPLVPILNLKTLDQLENPRLQRLKMQLGEFGPFTAHWIKGSEHLAADALSRSPVSAEGGEEDVDPDPDVPGACKLFAVTSEDNVKLEEVRAAAAGDEVARQLRERVLAGFPNEKKDLPAVLRPYWPVHEHLSVDDGLVVYGRRLVIPAALRRQMLQRLHASHLGKEKTKQRARQLLYWPGIDNEIDNLVRNCAACQR